MSTICYTNIGFIALVTISYFVPCSRPTYLSHTCAFNIFIIKLTNYIFKLSVLCTKNPLSFNSCHFFLLFSLYYCVFLCDIAGRKTISRDISFLCHRVIALIKAQVCGKYIYIYIYIYIYHILVPLSGR